jgi:predicted nucleotidyltransferase component of viral defense system
MLHKNAVEPITLELLTQICQLPSLTNFGLGGGTNIALRKGHRFSLDLDFFTNIPFDTASVYKTITTAFSRVELLFEQNQTMMFLVNEVKVDFVLYPFEWSQRFEITEGARLISPEDIIPMKLQAISNRFSKKDFWDIELLLQTYPLRRMIELFKLKFPPIDTGYIIHSLTNFENANIEEDPICLIHKTWKEVKHSIQEKVMAYTQEFL